MRKDYGAVPPKMGAAKQKVDKKLEAAFAQIAAELNVPLDKVHNIARRRLRQLMKGERTRRIQAVQQLFHEGCSREAIAEKLGLSISSVNEIMFRLVAAGKVDRRNKGRQWRDEERTEREEQIVKLRNEGYSNEEIAEQLELSIGTVNLWTHQLIADGRTESRWGKDATWRDLENERTKTIIEMVKRRAPLAEIGDAIELTRERARQLIMRMTEEHGEEVFAPDEELWTAREAADELKTTSATINKICAAGEVSCRRRGLDETGAWLIDEAGMEALRKHPLVTQERFCVVCGDVFTTGGTRASTCSEKCSKRRMDELREKYADQEPTAESLAGWRKDLWQRLQSHRIPKDEEWLTITEAGQRTGLSKMQLIWLRHRNIVTIRPDPVKKWRGQPVATYAASEMEIARQLFEAHANRNDKHD